MARRRATTEPAGLARWVTPGEARRLADEVDEVRTVLELRAWAYTRDLPSVANQRGPLLAFMTDEDRPLTARERAASVSLAILERAGRARRSAAHALHRERGTTLSAARERTGPACVECREAELTARVACDAHAPEARSAARRLLRDAREGA